MPGSRFAIMMKLARMGASDRVFCRHVPGIDSLTIRALRAIVTQQAGMQTVQEDDERGQAAG